MIGCVGYPVSADVPIGPKCWVSRNKINLRISARGSMGGSSYVHGGDPPVSQDFAKFGLVERFIAGAGVTKLEIEVPSYNDWTRGLWRCGQVSEDTEVAAVRDVD